MSLSDNIVKINLLRKGLDELRPLSRETADKLWAKLRLEWNYNSNHIEGNTLTYGETKLLLLFDKTTGDHEKREYDEMQAHDVAIHLVKEWAEDKSRDLTEADIKNLNKIILVRPYWKEALTYDGQPTRREIKVGDYKEFPNSVRLKTGEMFHYASPQETPRLMQELIDWYRTNEIQHPVILASQLHYRFICIHPFDDGNGRIARLLVNYILMKHGYTPTIIKSADKENYITALQKADAGNMTAFDDYIAEQVIWAMELEEKAALGRNLEDPDDIDKEIFLLKKHFKHETKLSERGTPEVVTKTIEENIIPLFQAMEKKAIDFNEFFFENDRKIYYKVDKEQGEYSLGSKESKWAILIKNWLIENIKANQKKVKEIRYNYELKGLRRTIDARNMWMGITISFDDYNYRIKTSEMLKEKTYAYGEKISEEEIQDVIKPMLKDIIQRIKDPK